MAARGLDIKVNYMVNYNLPTNINEYVEQIGETGQVGNLGVVISCLSSVD